MPRESTDRRKSSFGARRGPPRQHIPFRADDPARGKKTGMAVGYVDRNSDEIEPFDEVIKQADDRPPLRIKSMKKRISVAPPVEFPDEDGEMSMELAESNQGSPLAYFTNATHVYAPDSRRSNVSRHSMRASEIDYDQIPSPKAYLSVRQSSNGRASSALSKSVVTQEPTPDPEFDYADPGEATDFQPSQYNESPPRSRSPEVSPDAAGEEGEAGGDEEVARNEEVAEEEEAAEVEQTITAPNRFNKGKRRAESAEEDVQPDTGLHTVNGLEDDIAQGLEEAGNMQDEDNPPPTKKSKNEPKPRKPREKPVTRTPVERSPTPEGVRRGRRHRFKPLEWWRQEKVVYGRRDAGSILVPQIKEIIRIPQEPAKPLGKAGKRKRGTTVTRGKSKGRETPFNPEEGWDEDTSTHATVIDFDTKEDLTRRVAYLARMIEPKQAANSNWFFEKVFGDGEFIAAGQIHIPVGAQKPSKSTKDNTYVFYVIQGAVSVFIHETNFIIATGGMFLVPRGNTYLIENIAEREAKLFFTQARMMPAEDGTEAQHTSRSAPPPSHRRAVSKTA